MTDGNEKQEIQQSPNQDEYWIHHDGVVRIEEVRDNVARGRICHINYVQVCDDGSVTGGGSSFWWNASEFVPITSPVDILAAKADRAQREAVIQQNKSIESKQEYAVLCAAIKAIKESCRKEKECC